MKEFLIENYSLLTKSFEILAAMTGIFVYRKYRNSVAKYFIFFLIYIAILELVGGYVIYVRPDKFLHFLIGTLLEQNYWLYTLCWKVGAILFLIIITLILLKIRALK